MSETVCNNIKSTFVGKTFSMRLDFTATSSEKIALIFLTHGTMFKNFEFKVENVIVKERTGLLDLLQYKDGSMDAVAVSSTNSYGLKYTNDPSTLVTGDDHLSNTLPVLNRKVFGREVDQYYPDFAPIVGINRAGGIQQSDSFLQRQSAARAYLCLVSFGQSDI